MGFGSVALTRIFHEPLADRPGAGGWGSGWCHWGAGGPAALAVPAVGGIVEVAMQTLLGAAGLVLIGQCQYGQL